MKTAITTLALTLSANAVLAHPGHDHTYAAGGESHHLILIGAGIALVVALGVWMFRRARRSK